MHFSMLLFVVRYSITIVNAALMKYYYPIIGRLEKTA